MKHKHVKPVIEFVQRQWKYHKTITINNANIVDLTETTFNNESDALNYMILWKIR